MEYFSNISPYTLFGIALIVSALILLDRSNKKQRRVTGGGSSVLGTYTTDLTEMARNEKLDPVIGREQEIERVIHILSRRRKNNPLLLGEPGVGKTAIVEGLAIRIQKREAPENITKKRVLSLDLTGMISGTKYRGEFEERMRALTKEIEGMGRTIILFIDEIHMIEQSGGAEGAMDVSDILKPALARGDLQTIGATTWKEYEEFIRSDDALNRRFQPVLIDEPTPADTLQILKGIKKIYEEYHNVLIEDSAIKTAIEKSKKIKDRFLPDKALDLIDEACAKVSIEAIKGKAIALGAMHHAAAKAKQKGTPHVKPTDITEVIEEWIKEKKK